MPRMIKAKGGFDLSTWALYIAVALIIIAFLFMLLYGSFLKAEFRKIECKDKVDAALILDKIVACTAYSDDARTYFGIVDLGKFSEDGINNCIGKEFGERKVKVEILDKAFGSENEDFVEDKAIIRIYKDGQFETALLKVKMEEKC